MKNDCSLGFVKGKIPLNIDIDSGELGEPLGTTREYIEKITGETGTTGPKIEAYDMNLGDPKKERTWFGIACQKYTFGCEGCTFYKTPEKIDALKDISTDVKSLPITP